MLKLNAKGISHLLIPLIVVVVGVAAFGTYQLVASDAASKTCVKQTFNMGSSGKCIKYIQLMSGWHPSKADSQYGSVTQQGVKDIQGKLGMSQDGVVGKKTWRALCMVAHNKGPKSASAVVKKAGCTKSMVKWNPRAVK